MLHLVDLLRRLAAGDARARARARARTGSSLAVRACELAATRAKGGGSLAVATPCRRAVEGGGRAGRGGHRLGLVRVPVVSQQLLALAVVRLPQVRESGVSQLTSEVGERTSGLCVLAPALSASLRTSQKTSSV